MDDYEPRRVPVLIIADEDILFKIYVLEAQLLAGLNYIKEALDAEDGFIRLKFILQDLIATSHK